MGKLSSYVDTKVFWMNTFSCHYIKRHFSKICIITKNICRHTRIHSFTRNVRKHHQAKRYFFVLKRGRDLSWKKFFQFVDLILNVSFCLTFKSFHYIFFKNFIFENIKFWIFVHFQRKPFSYSRIFITQY